jgi:hypothetical protein
VPTAYFPATDFENAMSAFKKVKQKEYLDPFIDAKYFKQN